MWYFHYVIFSLFSAPTEAPPNEDEQTSNSVQEVANENSNSDNANSNANGGIVALRASYNNIIHMIERIEQCTWSIFQLHISNHFYGFLLQCTAGSCTSDVTKPYCSTEASKAVGEVGTCIACQADASGSDGSGDGTTKVLINAFTFLLFLIFIWIWCQFFALSPNNTITILGYL